MQKRRIHVAFVIGAMTLGGTERQLLGILKHLDRDAYQPHLFTFYSHGELNSLVPDDVIRYCDQTDNARPTEISREKFRIPGSIQRRLVKSLRDYCLRHDIDVVYDRTYHVSLVTGAACKPLAIPYINTIVSDPYSDFFPTAGPFGIIKYWKLRRIYRNATRVLCVSDGLRQAASTFYRLPMDRFNTIYNFVDQERLLLLQEVARRRTSSTRLSDSPLGTLNRPLNIVAIGRLHRQKGIEVLLRAVQRLGQQHSLNFKLRIVGDGPERQSLESLTSELELQNHVQFVGSLDDPTEELAKADLYCLPSLGEGMPNSLIEALLAGVPSVATDCPHGPREITEGGKWAKLVPVGDVKTLADSLTSFARNPSDLRQAVRAGESQLLEKFSYIKAIKRLEIILEMVNNGAQRLET